MRYAHLRIVDDSLYVFCSHGIGGMIGAIMTGLFATTEVNEAGANGAFYGRWVQLGYQMIDILVWVATVTAKCSLASGAANNDRAYLLVKRPFCIASMATTRPVSSNPQAVTSYAFTMTCGLMLLLKYTIGIREPYNPNMDPEEFSKLGVRIGGPGALEGSLVLPPGMLKTVHELPCAVACCNAELLRCI